MKPATPIRALALIFFLFLLHAPSCRGQNDGYVTNSNLRGVAPFGSYQFGDIDNINLGTGTLNLKIPVARRPGRGLDTQLEFIYSSKIWVFGCVKNVQGITTCTWSLTDGPKTPVPATAPTGQLVWIATENDCVDRLGNEIIQINNTNFAYIAADGAQYRFPNSYLTHYPPNTNCGSGGNVNIGVSDNGAMELDTGDSGFFLHFKDGHQESWTNSGTYLGVNSTNGNQLNLNGDTLKRPVIFAWTSPPWTVRDSNGVSQSYTAASQNVSVTSQFPTTTCGGSAIRQLVNTFTETPSLTLPTGLQFRFTYDPTFGEITRADLPTGGYIRYDYVTLPVFDKAPPGVTCMLRIDSRRLAHRIVSPDGLAAHEQTWTYSYSSGGQTTVTDPLGFVTVHTFASDGIHETQTQFYDQASHLLRTVANTWASDGIPVQTNAKGGAILDAANWRITATTTTLADTNQVSQTATTYDSYTVTYNYGTPTTYTTSRVNPTETREYDYGSGAAGNLLRRTPLTYLHDGNSNYLNKHILDRVTSKTVYDSTANQCQGQARACAQTNYSYDTTSITQTSGVVQHDYANYPYTLTVRGNPTSVQIWRNTDGAWLTTTKYYDDLGNLRQTQDPLSHNTFFDYTDSFSTTGNICVPTGGSAQAFVTKITNHLGQFSRYSYFSCSSWFASATDPNNQVTSFTYDLVDRQLQTNNPDGGQITNCFTDVGGSTCSQAAAPIKVVTTSKITASTNKTVTTVLDGLGRISQTQLNSDPQGIDYTDITYDALGRKSTVSNPYRSTSDPTYGLTTTIYDALGRVCVVVPPDGTLPTGGVCPATSPANDVFTTYSGNTTTIKDQAGKSRKSVTDGLGRLTQVFEDPSGSNYETDYQYDALDNLTRVDQKGGDPNSANWRTRTFTYNSLSQLLTASNPESGTITYAYDNAGNLITKTSPAPNQTGSTTVTVAYCYDALNRLTSKAYTTSTVCPQTSPVATYLYDQSSYNGLTITNGIGRRTGMTDAAGLEAWSYDPIGRPLADRRTTNSVTKTTSYTYNFDGSPATVTYPSGRLITYTLQSSGTNTAGRLLSSIDSTGPINYATAASYAPSGALASLTNGASVISTLFYNSRLQPCRISVKSSGTAPTTCTTAGAGNVLDFTYGFNLGSADNGNVAFITNNKDNTRSQNFSYDQLNRIATAQTQTSGVTIPNPNCWGLTFGYNPWGNLLASSITGPAGCSEPIPLNVAVTTSNRISTNTVAGVVTNYCYDAAGNLIHTVTAPATCPTSGPYQYTFNAENQMTVTAGVTYTYDGDGKRAQKSTGKLYWYGMGGDPLDETDPAGVTNNSTFNEYIFFDGQRIARRDYQNNVNYYFADRLGTTRVSTNSSGSICYDADFYPFGGERIVTDTCDSAYKFTGKERDAESGLDNFGARYMGSSLGRFMSPDSTAYVKPINAQSWNLYAYARNNPLLYIDPTGNTVSLANCQDKNKCVQVLTNAAQLPKGVTAEVDKKGNLVLKGDLSQIKGGNAARLLQLVQSDKTANFWIGDKAPGLDRGQIQDVKGGLSGTTTQDYNQNFSVVQSDPSNNDSGLGGVFLNPDGTITAGQIPGANINEAAAHELLGHVWADLIGGQSAGTQGNMREALIAEDRVRNTDPARGLKIRHQDDPSSVQLVRTSDLPRITNPGSAP